MNTPRRIPSLLNLLLGIRCFGPVPLLLWFGVSTYLAYGTTVFNTALMSGLESQAQTRQDFMGAQVAAGGALYVFLMMICAPTMLEMATGMPARALLEFLFTRALNRGTFLRAERLAQVIFLTGPLFLNLAISPFAPKLDFGPEYSFFRHQFQLPFSEVELFAAWLAWSGVLCIYLVAGYHLVATKLLRGLILRRSAMKRGSWLIFLTAYGPVAAILPVITLCASMRINVFELSFSFFGRHLVVSLLGLLALISVVQPLSERGIRKLEFV
jgi:hypothetical protein